MKKIITITSLIAFLVTGLAAGAQANPLVLPIGKESPTVDGVSSTSEYPVGAGIGTMKVWLSRTADTVYAAFSGETTGWVALGFGSLKMDSALMFIGFVSPDGKAQLKIQKGSDRTHSDFASDALIQFAMKEDGGTTTLELALKASRLIGKGETQLPIIFAMGGADNFFSPHRARGWQQVKLE